MELLNLSITDNKSLTNVSEWLQWAEFGPTDIVEKGGRELQITLKRHCLEDFNTLERAKTAVPGFLRITYPLVRSRLILSGLKSLKRKGTEQFDVAQFEYIKKHLLGFKLKAEPVAWVFTFEDKPLGSLKDIELLPERSKRIEVTGLGQLIVWALIAALFAVAIYLKIS